MYQSLIQLTCALSNLCSYLYIGADKISIILFKNCITSGNLNNACHHPFHRVIGLGPVNKN